IFTVKVLSMNQSFYVKTKKKVVTQI
ncbi:uncharacterized protein METZ01_LOCUS445270, partial [marine metagenome]